MSDDDLIRRGDVLRAIHGVADFNRDVVDAIRALPALPPRITRADADARLDATLRTMAEADHAPRVACPKCFAEFPASAAERLALAADADDAAYAAFASAISRGEDWRPFDAPATKARAEFREALTLYRAAKPDSTGAAPHPVPMRLDLEHETILTLQHLKACAGAWEPDARIVGNVRAVEIHAACAEVLRRALPESEAAPPAAEPAPCGTCGGSEQGEEWDHNRIDDAGRPTLKPCPSCRPGGAT